MATRGRPIPAADVRAIQKTAGVLSVRAAARQISVDKNTVLKYRKKEQ